MIVIPMVGNGSRFVDAGFVNYKYEIIILDQPLFVHVVNSFKKYFLTEHFLFIRNSQHNNEDFIRSKISELGILKYTVINLEGMTRGQAETVSLGLESLTSYVDEHLLIFNIDTIRPGFEFPRELSFFPWVETFRHAGNHWSFVKPFPNTNNVSEIVEKVRISDLCCTGAYYFPKISEFLEIFKSHYSEFDGIEMFVAPMFESYLKEGIQVKFRTVEQENIFLCGTPEEYHSLNLLSLKELAQET